MLLSVALLLSCTRESAPAGFETPEATIQTLFRSYGVETMTQDEARRRLQARERFELLDGELFRSCFADWQGEHDQALGGFVFGQLVAAKDELKISLKDDVAEVVVAPDAANIQPVVLVRVDRAWKIDLRKSVPAPVRQSLYEVYRRARRAERQAR
mgnify:CR=1 FL=1|jgi:hypothetical protein